MWGIQGIEFFAQSFDRKIEPSEGFPYSARDPTSVFVLPQRRRASVEVKIRIEYIVRSSTRALRDRRLNSLYRRIIANENIGCAEITNGRGADEMHNRATFRPISSAKKYSLDGLFYFVSKPALAIDNTNNQQSICVTLLFPLFPP